MMGDVSLKNRLAVASNASVLMVSTFGVSLKSSRSAARVLNVRFLKRAHAHRSRPEEESVRGIEAMRSIGRMKMSIFFFLVN